MLMRLLLGLRLDVNSSISRGIHLFFHEIEITKNGAVFQSFYLPFMPSFFL